MNPRPTVDVSIRPSRPSQMRDVVEESLKNLLGDSMAGFMIAGQIVKIFIKVPASR